MLSSQSATEQDTNTVLSSHNTEIVTEHLGFVPMSFVDDVINSMNEFVFQGMASLEDFVVDWYGGNNELEVEQGISQLETLLLNAVDKRFDEFELYCLQSVFAVPDDLEIRLPHQVNVENVDSLEEQALDKELQMLRKRLASAKYANSKLKTHLVRTGRKLPLLQRQQTQFSQLSTDFPDDVQSLTQELNSLLQLVEKTKPTTQLLANLSKAGALADVQRNERAEYIRTIVQKQVSIYKQGKPESQSTVDAGGWVKHVEPVVLDGFKHADELLK